ncbi:MULTISPECIES: heavy metal-responsive transcriptional regulator [Streptomyces]|uniref:heavy metal-responsive transcriptional regulator n=1 Tax=Streptomyces TaxID=1883 RepID=UPI0006AEA602|nr:heavy metal-responsive transcriptional regulator [Streptomyces sp. XY413]KOV18964.1 MerR family transcriptional regulator [Streptomyces sp. XY413]
MRIGKLAVAGGLTTKTIRFYEQAGLLPAPPRTSGGYRDYPQQTVARLGFIRDAQAAGLTLAEIRSVLALWDSGQAPCARVGALIDQHLAEIERRMAELREAQTELRKLAGRAAVTDPDSCSEGEICTILSRS